MSEATHYGLRDDEIQCAINRAISVLNAWNEVTGLIPCGSSYQWEMEGILEDAVHCGIQAALRRFTALESEIESGLPVPDVRATIDALEAENAALRERLRLNGIQEPETEESK